MSLPIPRTQTLSPSRTSSTTSNNTNSQTQKPTLDERIKFFNKLLTFLQEQDPSTSTSWWRPELEFAQSNLQLIVNLLDNRDPPNIQEINQQEINQLEKFMNGYHQLKAAYHIVRSQVDVSWEDGLRYWAILLKLRDNFCRSGDFTKPDTNDTIKRYRQSNLRSSSVPGGTLYSLNGTQRLLKVEDPLKLVGHLITARQTYPRFPIDSSVDKPLREICFLPCILQPNVRLRRRPFFNTPPSSIRIKTSIL